MRLLHIAFQYAIPFIQCSEPINYRKKAKFVKQSPTSYVTLSPVNFTPCVIIRSDRPGVGLRKQLTPFRYFPIF